MVSDRLLEKMRIRETHSGRTVLVIRVACTETVSVRVSLSGRMEKRRTHQCRDTSLFGAQASRSIRGCDAQRGG